MEVKVDSNQIQAMEQQIEIDLVLFRAITLKYGDEKGVLRISQADINKADVYQMTRTPLKSGIKFKVTKREE